MRIVILADGNNKIGMGHVYRTLDLSKELKNSGHSIAFLTKESIAKKIISKTDHCKLIPKLKAHQTKKFLEQFAPEIIILDKLNETKNTLTNLQKFCPIIAIDYTGKHKDLINYGINILYPKSGITKNSYSSLDYAILDEKFKRNKKKKIKKEIKFILVLQGGADTYCFTPKILEAVSGLDGDFKISVVLGPLFECWSKLNQVLKQIKKPIQIYHNVKNMSSLMQKADFAITAGGNTLLELAYLGIPSLVICGEKFEVETANLLEKNGFGINAGFGGNLSNSKIRSHLKKIINDYPLRKKMNKMGPKLVDGNGNSRIAKIIQNTKL